MTNPWALSALWVGLALVATLLAIWFKISTALSEIVVGTVAQLFIGVMLGTGGLLGNTQWITFLAGTGAIVLTFLAGDGPKSCRHACTAEPGSGIWRILQRQTALVRSNSESVEWAHSPQDAGSCEFIQ